MEKTKDSQSTKEDFQENTLDMSEEKVKKNLDSQVTLKFQEKEKENNNNETVKIIQALADKLVKSKLLEWHKISLLDSRKGFALFFPSDKWELVENQLVEIK